jgi:predicted NodU family carbamoyl transferase
MILGIHIIGHDSGFALVESGEVYAVLEAERITGARYGNGMPLVNTENPTTKEYQEGVEYWANMLSGFLDREMSGTNHVVNKVVWAAPFHERLLGLQEKLVTAVLVRFKERLLEFLCKRI